MAGGNAKHKSSQTQKPSSFNVVRFLVVFSIQLGLAAAFLGGTAYLALKKHPDYLISRMPHLHTLADKLIFTIRLQVFSLATLFVGIALVIFARVTSGTINPLDTNKEQTVLVFKQCLQNTLEQFLLSASTHLILCTYLGEEEMKFIPLLVFYFVCGRVFFWIGYLISPFYRSLGFLSTFVPTSAALGYALYLTILHGYEVNLGTDMYRE